MAEAGASPVGAPPAAHAADGSERVAREVFLSSFVGDVGGLGSVVQRLAGVTHDHFAAPGSVLYRGGDSPDHFYFVVSGDIQLSRPGARDQVFGARSVVGVMDAILERPRMRTAIVTASAHLLKVRVTDWLALLEDNFDVARHVVSRMAADVHELRLRPAPFGGFDDAPLEGNALALAPAQREPLNLVDRILLLGQVPLFSRAGAQALVLLGELAEEVRAAAGEFLLPHHPGERQLVIVTAGEVVASLAEPERLARFGPASLIYGAGALGAAAHSPPRAVTDTRAIVIAVEDYFDIMEEHFGVARSALMAISEEREKLLDRGVLA